MSSSLLPAFARIALVPRRHLLTYRDLQHHHPHRHSLNTFAQTARAAPIWVARAPTRPRSAQRARPRTHSVSPLSPSYSNSSFSPAPASPSKSARHRAHQHAHEGQTHRRRRLATHRTVHPDGVEHPLKGDVDPTPPPSSSSSSSSCAAGARPVPRDAAGLVMLKDLSLPELERWVVDELGEKPFRARQLWRWLYAPGRLAGSFDEMTDLSLPFRARLAETARVDALRLHELHESADGTRKITFRVDGGGIIETVVIPADGRTTICVSSQWGCALNCQFCMTGRTGFKRSLSTGEIVDQIVIAKRLLERSSVSSSSSSSSDGNSGRGETSGAGGKAKEMEKEDDDFIDGIYGETDGAFELAPHQPEQQQQQQQELKAQREGSGVEVGRIGNVVFMGEGEPAHNLENVLRAVETIVDGRGLHVSHNKVTVSTSGLVPEIRRLARESPANLAVSLHATNDELRSWLMPINRKYPLCDLMQVLRDEFPRTQGNKRQHKVFFQYVMLRGVNDSLQDAKELVRLVAHIPCKINLIHFNPHEGTPFKASETDTILAFQDFLAKKGITVTVRRSRGDEDMMACGQLGKLGPQQEPAPRMRVPQRYARAVAAGGGDA